MNKTKQNVTRIEDLEDLEELDDLDDDTGYDERTANLNIDKFIRKNNNNNMHLNSGMNNPNYSDVENKNFIHPQMQYKNMHHNIPHNMPHNMPHNIPHNIPHNMPYNIQSNPHKQFNNYAYENQAYKNNDYYEPYEPVKATPSCVDVADHVKSCNVCSRLYQSDKTMYYIIISILAIICIILLKKVIDV